MDPAQVVGAPRPLPRSCDHGLVNPLLAEPAILPGAVMPLRGATGTLRCVPAGHELLLHVQQVPGGGSPEARVSASLKGCEAAAQNPRSRVVLEVYSPQARPSSCLPPVSPLKQTNKRGNYPEQQERL